MRYCLAKFINTFSEVQLAGGGRSSPCLFLKIEKKIPWYFWGNALIVLMNGLNLPFQLQFWVYMGKRLPNFFLQGPPFRCCKWNVSPGIWKGESRRSVLAFQIPGFSKYLYFKKSCPEKFLVVPLNLTEGCWKLQAFPIRKIPIW